MRILVFHEDLTKPSGAEVNTRDWALGLKARGHRIVAFSHRLGALAEEIRNQGIMVVNDPALVSEAPDIMLGSPIHSVAALAARFPESPIVQVAQNFDNWVNFPSPLPQVILHIAVDELNAEMLVNEFGIPRERVRIVYNAVDLSRLPMRTRPLPKGPERLLVFAKNQGGYIDAVRSACASRNIEVDFVGGWIGKPVENPLAAIVNYDIVIGSARTALEGAIAGAAVIVADYRGFAGMLKTFNLDHYRRNNFGRDLLTQPFDASHVTAAIEAYDADDAAAVSRAMLEAAGLNRQLDRMEAVFNEAIERFRNMPPTADDTRRALSSYLTRHLPRVTEGEKSPRHERFRPLPSIDDRMSALERQVAMAVDRTSDQQLDAMAAKIAAAVEQKLATSEHNRRAVAHQDYADALRARGFLQEAIREYTRSIEFSLPNTALFYLRGISRRDAGDHAGALADFEAGLALDPENGALKLLRANAQAALEQASAPLGSADP